MQPRTLLLNAWMMPQRVIAWEEAVTLWFLGKVDVLEHYEELVRSPSIAVPLPAVVRVRRAVAYARHRVRFSREAVFGRDGYRCQYCGEKKGRSELSFDHVVPRTAGGRTAWENIVTACRPCNAGKRNRTPEQAGMRLLRRPVRPTSLPVDGVSLREGWGVRDMPEEWRGYCPTPLAR